MRRISYVISFSVAVAAAATFAGCSSDKDNGNTGGGGGASGSTGASGGGSTSTASCNLKGGATGSGGGTFTRDAVCMIRNKSTANATTFSGYEEYVLMTADGNDTELCVVRYDVKRVGAAVNPEGCKVAALLPDGDDCTWTNLVEYSNPQKMLDTDGACAKSSLAMTDAAIAAKTGTRINYGFAPEAAGHASLVMASDCSKWDIWVNGTYEASSSTFRYEKRNPCLY